MKIIGHRGAKGLAPENTSASFQTALSAGVDMIEIDMRTSADDQLVVAHDSKIGNLEITKNLFSTLRAEKSDLLILPEALEVINGKCPVIIEVKKGSDMSIVISVFKNLKLPPETMLASFNMHILKAVKNAFPDIGLIVNEKWSGVRGTYRCRKLGTKYIAINQRWLWSGFIKSLSRSGYKLSAYTLNDPVKAKVWAKYGLYAAITDRPDLFRN